jgi:hypothetical protein
MWVGNTEGACPSGHARSRLDSEKAQRKSADTCEGPRGQVCGGVGSWAYVGGWGNWSFMVPRTRMSCSVFSLRSRVRVLHAYVRSCVRKNICRNEPLLRKCVLLMLLLLRLCWGTCLRLVSRLVSRSESRFVLTSVPIGVPSSDPAYVPLVPVSWRSHLSPARRSYKHY